MEKRIFVFSVDAMVYEDLETLSTLPNFKKYLSGGSSVKKIRSIYPSVTYPAHVSMSTGCYPDKHGVTSNYSFTTDSKEDTWQWFHSPVKVKDIFDAAKEKGYTTGAVFWPVLGCHKSIDYLIDEYWMPEKDQTLLSAFEKVGSSPEMLKIIDKNKDKLAESYVLTGRTNFCIHPKVDSFLISCTCDIIRQYAPEVMFIHNGIIDHLRHATGVFSKTVKDALSIVDDHIGQIGRALEDAGVLNKTDFFLVSDHGQRDIKRTIKPNVLLAENGLIKINEKGKAESWDAYCLSNAMSSCVYLRDKNDKELYDRVYGILTKLADEGIYGFNKVFTSKETAELYHLDGDFSFVIESDGYTSFSDSCKRPLIQPLDLSDFRFGRATHGYLPEEGPQPTLVAKGPHIKEGVVIENADLVDEAPTYAALLGAELPDAQGKALLDILK